MVERKVTFVLFAEDKLIVRNKKFTVARFGKGARRE